MLSQISYIILTLTVFFRTYFSWLGEAGELVRRHFGLIGQISFFVFILYLTYLIISKIMKVVFHVALWVLLPSVLLSGIGACFFNFNFSVAFSICLCLMIAISFVRH